MASDGRGSAREREPPGLVRGKKTARCGRSRTETHLGARVDPLEFAWGTPVGVERLKARRRKVPNRYLDMALLVDYWAGGTRAYHHTAPINMLYGLYQAPRLVVGEGLKARFARHREAHARLVEGVERPGLEMLVEPEWRLPLLNAVRVLDALGRLLWRKAFSAASRRAAHPTRGPFETICLFVSSISLELLG